MMPISKDGDLLPPIVERRLHLGCGEIILPGYVNIDYPPSQHNVMLVRPDLEADITTVDFPHDTIAEIRLHHVFEHFSRVAAIAQLIRWHRWLKIGGLLVIETPDFEATAKAALEATGAERVALLRHLEGDQAAGWGYHIVQWYPERFISVLTTLGFKIVEVASVRSRWHVPPLFNVTARATKARQATDAELISVAESLLAESMVDPSETRTFDIWREQLRTVIAGGPVPRPT